MSTWAAVNDDKSRKIMDEIDLYIAGLDAVWTWLLYIYECRDPNFGQMGHNDELQDKWLEPEMTVFLIHCIRPLPSSTDLKLDTDTATELSYKRSYAEYAWRNPDKTNRQVVLLGVGFVRREMCRLQPLIRSQLTAENQLMRCTKLDEHLAASEQAFDAWEAVAVGELAPSVVEQIQDKRRHVSLEDSESSDSEWHRYLRTLADAQGNLLEKCTFCDINIRDVVYMPCGHFAACRSCALEWTMRSGSQRCPFCIQKAVIDSVQSHVNGTTVVPFKQHARLVTRDIFSLMTELKRMAGERPVKECA